MDRPSYKARIFRIVKSEIDRKGYHFSPETERHIKRMISSGIDQISDLDDPHQRQMAEANARKGIDAMLKIAAKTSSKELNRNIYEQARACTCPIWPYCK